MREQAACVGVVVPMTGRLASLGRPLSFVLRESAGEAGLARRGDGRAPVRVAVRDSRSEPGAARRAVRELAEDERVSVVLTMAGTEVLPAVAGACEEAGVPCVSTTFPWQAYGAARGGGPHAAFRWTYHFAWGLDDIADVFADLWQRARGDGDFGRAAPGGGGSHGGDRGALDGHRGTAGGDRGAPGGGHGTPGGGRGTGTGHRPVGCLWNDGLQGRLLRDGEFGFAGVARRRGYTLADPGPYAEPAGADGFGTHLRKLRDAGADIVTSAATAADLALFLRRARADGWRPRLVTCSRWLTYPHPAVARSLDVQRELSTTPVATLVYWSPFHPYVSGLDGRSCAQLAEAYRRATGRMWLQPLGVAHALLEVAHHVLRHAPDPGDRAAVAHTLARTRVDTIAGTLDWTAGPTPNVARVPLAGGQWQTCGDARAGDADPGGDGAPRLRIVDNSRAPDVPLTGDLVTAG